MTQKLSPEVMAELAKLRDIRLPEPVGWWPLAPGWWALIALGLVLLATAAVLEIRRRRSLRFLALTELRGLKAQLSKDADPHRISVDLAVLLRRVALATSDGTSLPAMAGPAWVQELTSGKAGLSPRIADFLAEAPYAPPDPANTNLAPTLQAAFTESERWIRRRA